MPVVTVDPHGSDDRRFVRAMLEIGVRASYPDLERLGRLSARERLDGIFDARWARDDKRIWVARVDGAPAGAIWLEPEVHAVTEVPGWLIVVLAVDAAHRGRGVARALSEAVQAFAAASPHPRLRMFTGAANEGTRRLYASLGYAEATIEMRWEAPRA